MCFTCRMNGVNKKMNGQNVQLLETLNICLLLVLIKLLTYFYDNEHGLLRGNSLHFAHTQRALIEFHLILHHKCIHRSYWRFFYIAKCFMIMMVMWRDHYRAQYCVVLSKFYLLQIRTNNNKIVNNCWRIMKSCDIWMFGESLWDLNEEYGTKRHEKNFNFFLKEMQCHGSNLRWEVWSKINIFYQWHETIWDLAKEPFPKNDRKCPNDPKYHQKPRYRNCK